MVQTSDKTILDDRYMVWTELQEAVKYLTT